MELIQFSNDHKEKAQSWDAKIEINSSSATGYYTTSIYGWGEDKEETKEMLLEQLHNLLNKLELNET